MRISSIASGSSGNCIYIGSGNTHIMIDAGISKKRVEEGLQQHDITLQDISAILITHEHIDHIQGLGVIARKYNIPMYATYETIEAILATKSIGEVSRDLFHCINPDSPFSIEELMVNPFAISHDAANPLAYKIESKNQSLAVLTDLGMYNEYIINQISNVDTIFLEANHDKNMLQVGKYPYYVKQRILSEKGHLSNEASGKLLSNILHDGLKYIILGHLSKENNYDKLAYETVRSEMIVAEHTYKADDFPIKIAKYNNVLEMIEF